MVLIFTEKLAGTGMGHLSRCTALFELISEFGDPAEMILYTDDDLDPHSPAIAIKKYDWFNSSVLEKILDDKKPRVCFLDSYMAPPEIYEVVAQRNCKLVCIDDYNRIAYPRNSIILNPGFAPHNGKRGQSGNVIISGLDYVLLRKPFREQLKLLPIREHVKTIFFSVGGEDSLDLTEKVVSFLSREYPELNKRIIIGPQFVVTEQFRQEGDKKTQTLRNLTAPEMRNLMLECDLAITAGGQTTYELARCGVPMIILKVAENQQGNINGWLNEKIIEAYCDETGDALKFISEEIQRLTPRSEREKCRIRSPERIGGGNAYARLVD